MTKARIIPGHPRPGFGGLNRSALIEDGWSLDLLVDVTKVLADGRAAVEWIHNGETMRRVLHPHEYLIIEESDRHE